MRLSTALPGQGPYSAERAAFPTSVIEGPIAVTIVAGSRRITCARGSSPSVVSRPLVIFTDDASQDSDLEGNIVEAQGENYYDVDRPFTKSGSYTGYVLKRWWDLATAGESGNNWYQWFPIEQLGEKNQATWRTLPLPYPTGTFRATACSRNLFGVGARITTEPKVFVDVSVPVDSILIRRSPESRRYWSGRNLQGGLARSADGRELARRRRDPICDRCGIHSECRHCIRLGKRNHLEGTDPDKTYWFAMK